jgi:hypothetical protein
MADFSFSRLGTSLATVTSLEKNLPRPALRAITAGGGASRPVAIFAHDAIDGALRVGASSNVLFVGALLAVVFVVGFYITVAPLGRAAATALGARGPV